MTKTADSAQSVSPTTIVTEDAFCIQCNYNLRTLPLDEQCPECGQLVIRSVGRAMLVGANIRWLKRVRLGLALWITALLLPALAVPIIIKILALMGAARFTLGGAAAFFAPGALGVGALLLGSPAPGAFSTLLSYSLRVGVQVLGCLVLAGAVATAVCLLCASRTADNFLVAECMIMGLTIAAGAFYVPGFARCTADPDTYAAGRTIAIGLVAFGSVGAVMLVLRHWIGIFALLVCLFFALCLWAELVDFCIRFNRAIKKKRRGDVPSFQPGPQDPQEEGGADQGRHDADGQAGGG